MSNNEPLLKKLDEFIFKSIETLMSQPSIQEASDQFSSLDEDVQKFLNQLFSILLVLIPFIFSGFLVYKNNVIRNELQDKKIIIKSISQFLEKNNQLQKLQSEVTSPMPVNSKTDIERKLQGWLTQKNVKPKSVEYINFKQLKPTVGLIQSNLDLVFRDLTPGHLTFLIDTIVNREKMKVAHVQVEKDQKSKLLKGKLHIIHFGKANKK